MFKRKYRIIKQIDNDWLRIEYRLWFWPFWLDVDSSSTRGLEDAKEKIEILKNKVIYKTS